MENDCLEIEEVSNKILDLLKKRPMKYSGKIIEIRK